MKICKMQNYRDKKRISAYQGLTVRDGWLRVKEFERTLLYLNCANSYMTAYSCQNYLLKRVNHTVCKLHLNKFDPRKKENKKAWITTQGFIIFLWKVKSVSCSAVSDSLDSMDCSLPGSSVHGILQARILEWLLLLLLLSRFSHVRLCATP